MKFVIVDTAQYAYGESKISPEYINKLKDKYKLETIKINKRNKEYEYSLITDVEDNMFYSDAFKKYTFAGGTPFGIKEDE